MIKPNFFKTISNDKNIANIFMKNTNVDIKIPKILGYNETDEYYIKVSMGQEFGSYTYGITKLNKINNKVEVIYFDDDGNCVDALFDILYCDN